MFLGPGFSHELEIMNWNNKVSQLLIHWIIIVHIGSIGKQWIRSFQKIDMKPWICKDSELGGNAMYII